MIKKFYSRIIGSILKFVILVKIAVISSIEVTNLHIQDK